MTHYMRAMSRQSGSMASNTKMQVTDCVWMSLTYARYVMFFLFVLLKAICSIVSINSNKVNHSLRP